MLTDELLDTDEKRHKNVAVHCSPAFRVEVGDIVTVGQCRPLSKTVRYVLPPPSPSPLPFSARQTSKERSSERATTGFRQRLTLLSRFSFLSLSHSTLSPFFHLYYHLSIPLNTRTMYIASTSSVYKRRRPRLSSSSKARESLF